VSTVSAPAIIFEPSGNMPFSRSCRSINGSARRSVLPCQSRSKATKGAGAQQLLELRAPGRVRGDNLAIEDHRHAAEFAGDGIGQTGMLGECQAIARDQAATIGALEVEQGAEFVIFELELPVAMAERRGPVRQSQRLYRREICHVWSVLRLSRWRAELADRHNDPQPRVRVGASIALAMVLSLKRSQARRGGAMLICCQRKDVLPFGRSRCGGRS
jgi:hypothetical protein